MWVSLTIFFTFWMKGILKSVNNLLDLKIDIKYILFNVCCIQCSLYCPLLFAPLLFCNFFGLFDIDEDTLFLEGVRYDWSNKTDNLAFGLRLKDLHQCRLYVMRILLVFRVLQTPEVFHALLVLWRNMNYDALILYFNGFWKEEYGWAWTDPIENGNFIHGTCKGGIKTDQNHPVPVWF